MHIQVSKRLPTNSSSEVPKSKLKSKSELRSEKDEAMFTKSAPTSMKLKLKDGSAVDPDSGLEDKAHVLREGNTIYNVVLGMVDIARGSNSYYKLQLLEADNGSR